MRCHNEETLYYLCKDVGAIYSTVQYNSVLEYAPYLAPTNYTDLKGQTS